MSESAGDSSASAGDSLPPSSTPPSAGQGEPTGPRSPRLGFYIVDGTFRFTYVDRQAAELWGVEPSSLIGRVLWDAFPTAASSRQYEHHQRAMNERSREEYAIFSPRYQCWFQMSIEPLGTGGLLCYFTETEMSGA